MTDRPHRDAPHTGHLVEGDLGPVAGVVFDALAVPDHSTSAGWVARGAIQSLSGPVVFLVHPTTHRSPSGTGGGAGEWFGDPADPSVRAGVEQVVASQAMAFGGELWAPHYRAASTRAFVDRANGGELAYDLAAADVRAAFTQFLVDEARRGGGERPLVLVGHSQGARHVRALIEEFFTHPGLARRLVAAYVIGVAVEADAALLDVAPLARDPHTHGVTVAYQARLSGQGPVAAPEGVCVDVAAFGLAESSGVSRADGHLVVTPERAGDLASKALPDGRLHHVEVEVMADALAADVARRTRSWRAAQQMAAEPEAALNVIEAGPAATNQVPVVLLHKLGGWAAEWRDVARELSADRRVLVVDLPGHGDSVRPGDAPWVQWPADSAADVITALDGLGVEQFHLVGASMGGVVGAHLAARLPERVVSLTLIATSATPALSARRTQEIDDAVRDGFEPGWVPRPGQNARAATTSTDVMRDQDASRARAGRWVRACERGVGLAGVEQVLGEVGESGLPVLCLDGERAPYRRYAPRIAELVADVRFEVVAGAGAFVHQEQPVEVATRWSRFAGRCEQ